MEFKNTSENKDGKNNSDSNKLDLTTIIIYSLPAFTKMAALMLFK